MLETFWKGNCSKTLTSCFLVPFAVVISRLYVYLFRLCTVAFCQPSFYTLNWNELNWAQLITQNISRLCQVQKKESSKQIIWKINKCLCTVLFIMRFPQQSCIVRGLCMCCRVGKFDRRVHGLLRWTHPLGHWGDISWESRPFFVICRG